MRRSNRLRLNVFGGLSTPSRLFHWAGAACGLAASLNLLAAPKEIQFNRDIRPILSENCFACHGPDKNQRKAKLRLDVRDVALEKGAIVPGKLSESELVRRI